MTDSSNQYVRRAYTDQEKYAEVRRIFGDQAEEILQKCGTIAYDYMRNNMEHNFYGYGYANNSLLFNQIKASVSSFTGEDLLKYTYGKYDKNYTYDERHNDVVQEQQKYTKYRNQEIAAERARQEAERKAAEPVVDQKLKDFLKRTIGSDDLAMDLTKKYGDKAYEVALSAVVEPGAMVSGLGIKVDGAFSSKNLLATLAKNETNLDTTKLNTFLAGASDRRAARAAEQAAREAEERAERERQQAEVVQTPIQRVEMPEVTPRINIDRPEIKPENIQLAGVTRDLPFVQDGKRYNLYDLPDGFVIKGDLDLSNRGLTELPDLSKVKVKGSLNLSGNELTSIEGRLPEVGKDINLSNNKLTSLNGMPNKVKGNFSCAGNQLATLEGGPEKVTGAFDCRDNKLTTLEGGPKEVGKSYICSDNMLSNLKGAPAKINGNFGCYNNQLTTLEGAPKYVAGDFLANDNALMTLEHAPKEVGKNFMAGGNPLANVDGIKRVGELHHDELLTQYEALAQQAIKVLPYFSKRQELLRDMHNLSELAGIKNRVVTDMPSADDARFDQAYARRENERQTEQPKMGISKEDVFHYRFNSNEKD